VNYPLNFDLIFLAKKNELVRSFKHLSICTAQQGYVSSLNRFIEAQIPIHDERLFVDTGKHVVVMITSSRALGLTDNSSFLTEVRLRIREFLQDVKITSNKVTIRTSDSFAKLYK
jgi:hypothetical protein